MCEEYSNLYVVHNHENILGNLEKGSYGFQRAWSDKGPCQLRGAGESLSSRLCFPPCPITAHPCEKPLSVFPAGPFRHWTAAKKSFFIPLQQLNYKKKKKNPTRGEHPLQIHLHTAWSPAPDTAACTVFANPSQFLRGEYLQQYQECKIRVRKVQLLTPGLRRDRLAGFLTPGRKETAVSQGWRRNQELNIQAWSGST